MMQFSISDQDRFFSKVHESGECWAWHGAIGKHGYGNFFSGGKTARAHRWSYEFFRADIPDGLHIDHPCRVRHCVNPWHLEPVTVSENQRRIPPGVRKRPRFCKHGHELTGENLYVQTKAGFRYCRTCNAARSAAYLARRAHIVD